MTEDRIHFAGNPWPEGHPIARFVWSAQLVGGEVWFDFHLETADYYSERDIEDDEEVEYGSDWEAPIVWCNYHSCTLSTSAWHEGGFPTGIGGVLTPEALDGLELAVDSPPSGDLDEHAFHVYLLGHDAVGDHRIRFSRIGETDRFDIEWTGKIALVYAGDEEYRHSFSASLHDVPMPRLPAT